ncbi:MAG: hypothetical protein EOP50_19930, partial [Sphingobacteriales bacterium]
MILRMTLSAGLLLLLASCARNADDANNPEPTPVNGMVRAYELDTTLMHPVDTVGRYTVTYDALGRPSVYTYTQFKPTGDSLWLQRFRYFYNGNERRAEHTEQYTRTSLGTATIDVVTDNHYYTWANDKLVYDSSVEIYLNNLDTTYYVTRANRPVAGKVLWEQRHHNRLSNANDTSHGIFYQTFQGDNLTVQLDTLLPMHPGASSFYGQRDEMTSSYASAPNPFHVISYPVFEDPQYRASGISDWINSPKNMLIERTKKSWYVPGTVPA